MNHPRAERPAKGMRLRLFVAIAAVAAFSAFLPAAASADITSTVTGIFSDPTPGAHSTYTNIQDFEYDGNGTEPQAGTEDLRKWVIDGPAGLIGNPNAVPKEDRCTLAEFQDFVTNSPSLPSPPFINNCPAASVVGSAAVTMSADAAPVDIDLNGAASGVAAGGIIYLIDSGDDPEIPVTLGTSFPGLGLQTRSSLAPVTSGIDGDFRIRTIPLEDSNRPVLPGPTNAHIRQIVQILNANAGNGVPWLTNPTRCSSWDTYSYVTAYDSNTNADSNPDPAHPNEYKKSAPSSTTPDCTTRPAFPAKLEAKLSNKERTSNPQLDVVLTNSNTPGVDVPKDVTLTLPGAVAADIDAVAEAKLCTVAQRDADACPAASKVGTVKIETPFLVAGLTGDVHIIKKDVAGLPDIAIFVDGAIKFRLDGITSYVGPEKASIETKLTNLPQALFSKFSLTIDGGKPDSLLYLRECPTDGSSPLDGPITSSMTGYSDATVNGSDATELNGCYGTPRVSSFKKCVKYKLKFTPRNLQNKANIMKVEVWVKGRTGKAKRVKVYRKSPFKASVALTTKRFTSGRSYKYKVRVVYKPTVDAPKGKVLNSKYAKFKKC